MEEDNLEFALTSESDAPVERPANRGTRSSHKHDAATGNDAELLVAMRAGRSRAMRAFYVRFRPVLLDQAYKLGVAIEEREDVVTEFLGDIALKLIEAPSVPRTLAAYVLTAFRHAVISQYRKRGRNEAHQHDATDILLETREHAVTTVCSEYSLRLVRGDDVFEEDNPEAQASEAPATHGTLSAPATLVADLAARLLAGLSEADRELLTWLGERVPTTAIAAWRGVTNNAVKVKISRLRARLRAEAGVYLTELDGEARNELERFFRRAGVLVTPPPVVKTVVHQPLAHPCRLSPIGDVTMHAGYPSPYGPEDA